MGPCMAGTSPYMNSQVAKMPMSREAITGRVHARQAFGADGVKEPGGSPGQRFSIQK